MCAALLGVGRSKGRQVGRQQDRQHAAWVACVFVCMYVGHFARAPASAQTFPWCYQLNSWGMGGVVWFGLVVVGGQNGTCLAALGRVWVIDPPPFLSILNPTFIGLWFFFGACVAGFWLLACTNRIDASPTTTATGGCLTNSRQVLRMGSIRMQTAHQHSIIVLSCTRGSSCLARRHLHQLAVCAIPLPLHEVLGCPLQVCAAAVLRVSCDNTTCRPLWCVLPRLLVCSQCVCVCAHTTCAMCRLCLPAWAVIVLPYPCCFHTLLLCRCCLGCHQAAAGRTLVAPQLLQAPNVFLCDVDLPGKRI